MIYTTTTLQKAKSNAILIDIAGRQRMLFEKHLNEVFSTSQGIPADYKSTRKLLRSTLASLMKGGPVILDSETGKSQTIPVVPTEEILLRLHEQENYFDKVIESADDLLLLAPDHPEFHGTLKTLRAQNSTLINIADDAVKQLDRHSELSIETMVKWETIIAIFVGLLGVYITGHGIREGRRLEDEIEERKRAESALRDSELFLNSIVENIPDMIFVKDAKELQFLRFNKAGEELVGYPRAELLGKTDYDFFPKPEADWYATKDREVLSGKTLMDIPEEIIQTKAHERRYLHTKKIPILDVHGNPEYLLGISEDITERKQAELERTQRESLLRLIIETGPGCIKRVAADGTLLHMNPTGLKLIEAEEENEALGLSVFDLVVPEHIDAFRQMHQTVLKGEQQTLQFEIQGFKGTRRWMETFAVPFSNPITKEVEQLAVTHDITERKKSEMALEGLAQSTVNLGNQDFFENLVYQLASTLQVPMVLLAERVEETFPIVHGLVFWYGDHFEPEFKYDCHDAPCENVFDGHPMYFPQGVQELFPKDTTLETLNIESYCGTPLFNSEGAIIGNLVIMDKKPLSLNSQDNSLLQIFAARAGAELQRKRAEEALQKSEERYRILYEDNPSMYFTVAQDGTILSVNLFGAQQLGYSVRELVGQPVIGIFLEDDKPLIQEHFNVCLQNPMKIFNWELRKQKKDGSVLWVRETARALKSQDKEAVVLIVCEDITERKQTEERLRQSEAKEKEALLQSDGLKSALLSSVSHELRTPLTAMKGSVSSIMGNGSGSNGHKHQEALKGIDREIDYMSQLVNNLLDMSQIEAGTLIPHKEWHLLEDLVEGALRRTEQTLDTRKIDIHIPENVPPVFVDAVQMQQVLINLLDNAVKYSLPASPIRLNIRIEAQNIAVEASNEGEPIQPQDLELLFDRFYRRPPVREQPIHGTGLGLAICKGLVEAHGGRIWAESIGKKVTITFTIPTTEHLASFSLEGRHKSKRE
jgi:PAS domain S-box-containing protein